MLRTATAFALFALIATRTGVASAQTTYEESNDLVREYAQGFLSNAATVAEADIRDRCVPAAIAALPAGKLDDGPHGDSLVATRCAVLDYGRLAPAPGGPWFVARYRLTSIYTPLPPRSTRTEERRDTVTRGVVVLLASAAPGRLRPVWRQAFEYAVTRSVGIEIAPAANGVALLRIEACVNGTGGCDQEFLRRASDGRWTAVRPVWLRQLPEGFARRMAHGFSIDPRTLRGTAALYDANDANCCPSNTLELWLELREDSLSLQRHAVTRTR